MPRFIFPEIWHLLSANILREAAASCEATAGRRIHRTGDITFEDDTAAFLPDLWDRDRRQQGLRIRMERILKDSPVIRQFDDLAEVHDGDAVGKVIDHA